MLLCLEIVKIATTHFILKRKKRREKATILTPIEINKGYEERLKRSIKEMTERDVDLEFVLEPLLAGGGITCKSRKYNV